MKKEVKIAIKEYQCSGCTVGGNVECFVESDIHPSVGCGKHHAGTMATGVGNFYLGMPKGFNRLGEYRKMKPIIFESFETCDWPYNKFNIPVWKHLNKEGHTIVRGISPRKNEPFIHIFLEDCMSGIDCIEILQSDIDEMD